MPLTRPLVLVDDEGVLQGQVTTLDFIGAGVTATIVGGEALITVPGGGGGGTLQWVEQIPSPRLSTTASIAIGITGSAQTRGVDNFFFVSGTITSGTSADQVVVFGGTTVVSGNFSLAYTGLSSSYVELPWINAPAARPNTTRMYGTQRASRSLIEQEGPSGLSVPLQPSLFGNSICYASPSATTAIEVWGTGFTTSGTISHPTQISLQTSGVLGSVRKARFTGINAIGNGGGIRTTDTVCWRGNYTGSGGWFMHCRFGHYINPPSRMFIGLNSTNAYLGHQTDISASAEFIGIGWDRLDPLTGSWRVMRKDASTYVTEQIPNMIRAFTTGSIIDFICFAPPNSSVIHMQVREFVSTSLGVETRERWQNSYTSSIPVSTTFLRIQGGMFNHTGANGTIWDMNRLYLETDL